MVEIEKKRSFWGFLRVGERKLRAFAGANSARTDSCFPSALQHQYFPKDIHRHVTKPSKPVIPIFKTCRISMKCNTD